MIKIFYFVVLVFLVSCSSENEETMTTGSQGENLTSFEKLFFNPSTIFDNYNLGDSLSQEIIVVDSLPSPGNFTYKVLTFEEKANHFELDISLGGIKDADLILKKIVDKYNAHLNQNKSVSNFVTWTYTTVQNLPAEIILIYEKELNTISLDVGYKSQR